MRRPEWRLAAAVALLLAQGCAVSAPPLSTPLPISAALPAEGPLCRVGPDGGPPQTADRGIGGTGAPATLQADRGIGGTGIIGVITGFASLCLAGREIVYGPDLPITEDGRTTAVTALRAGQVAAVEAGPTLTARRVAIRHELVGPVQENEAGILRIAGQRVAILPQTLGVQAPPKDTWVAISGFRDTDGMIQATRIDPLPGPGNRDILVRGILLHEGNTFRIGTLEVRPAPGIRLRIGQPVVVTGHWRDGVLLAEDIQPEPGTHSYFGPMIGVVVIEGFAGVNEGRLVLTRSEGARSGEPDRRSLVELERRPDGTLHPATVRELGALGRVAAAPGAAPGRAGPDHSGGRAEGAGTTVRPMQAAPVPNRAINGTRGSNDPGQRPEGAGRGPSRGRGAPPADPLGGGGPIRAR